MPSTETASLTEALAEQNVAARQQIPDAALEVMDDATEQLRRSDLLDGAVDVGDTAPSFALPNATGDPVRLDDLLDDGPVVLSFYRGQWCPYCNLELRHLQAALSDVEAEGAQLVAVSPQTPDASLSTAEKHDLAFDVLSDEGNEVADAYGLVFSLPEPLREVYDGFGIDLPATNGDDAWTLPVPATFVIDTDGTVRYAFADVDYTHRADPADVVDALRDL